MMTNKEEKLLILSGIEQIKKEGLDKLDNMERMLNMMDCLIALNWKEVGRRDED